MALSDQFSDENLGIKPPPKGAGPLSSQFSDQNLAASPAAAAPPAPLLARVGTAIGTAVPFLGGLGASIAQGGRDIDITAGQAERWLGQNVPGVAAVDRLIGYDPDKALAQQQAETQAYQQQYGGNPWAMFARYGTQMALTAPLLAPLAGAVPAMAAAPGASLAARAAAATLPAATKGAIMGGGTNLLASGGMGENPLTAGATGAVGGAILGPLAETAGNVVGAVKQPLVDAANRLGIDLTLGQRMGGLVHWAEDATKMFPGAGANAANTRLQTQIANVIRKEGGMSGSGAIDTQGMLQGLQDAGNRIGNAVRGASIPATDQGLWQDLQRVQTNAAAGGTGSAQANYFNTLVGELRSRMVANGGPLSGNDLQTMIEYNRPLQNAMSSQDGEVQRVGQGVYDALMQAAERNNPGVTAALRDARYQYKVLATAKPQIDKYIGGTEDMSNLGFAKNIDQSFDKPRLNPTATTGANSNAMNDLAGVIRGTQPPRSSGTTERALAWGGGAAGLAGVAYALQHPYEAEQWVQQNAPYGLAAVLGGRAMRFAPGIAGLPVQGVNRLIQTAPQALGPWAGRTVGNWLGGNYAPAPGAPRQ